MTVRVDEYWAALASMLPVYRREEQRAAVLLYHELARGSAVTSEQLGRALHVSGSDADALLDRPCIRSLTYRDAQGQIVGFGGLAVVPMHHTMRVGNRTLWTWCAWDSLFIPEILECRAEVESTDPETGRRVQLTVTPDGIDHADPEGAVVSFIAPEPRAFDESARNAMASFCHYIFYFESRDSGDRWTARHAGTFLYSLGDAVELARRLNRTRFGAALGGRARVEPPPASGAVR
jgi:alkylmercury lyase